MVLAFALVACDEDERPDGSAGVLDGGELPDAGPVPEGATRFVMRIENVAGPAFPTALGAGIAVVHDAPDPLFTEGARDRGLGLEALAEDGDPRPLAAALGGATFGAIAPGAARNVIVDARPGQRLSFATMLLESNDVFLAPDGRGIALFDEAGRPLPDRDVSEFVHVWNAGTEIDQAPGLGPEQAARQAAPGTGAREGTIRPFTDGTRTLPLARDLVRLDVRGDGPTYTIGFANVSEETGLLVTPLSALVWMIHDGTTSLFEEGEPAPDNGLEALAEDADARRLSMWAAQQPGVRASGVADRPVGAGRAGLTLPGERVEITVQPDAAHPFLNFASKIVVANDAFLALPSPGVRLLHESGAPRDPAAIERDLLRSLVVWDAGTEANQVPGAGLAAGALPEEPNTGPADPDPRVRRYDDVTNDVAQENLGHIVDVRIRRVEGTTFEVSILNRSHSTPYAMLLTPFVHSTHPDGARLFDPASPPSPGLISLAEDCFTNMLHEELLSRPGFETSSVYAQPEGASEAGPLRDGQRYVFTVTASRERRRFNMASMPYPSNDMFLAFDPEGLELLDPSGTPRSDAAIAADVRRMLRAWDVGTEANQAGGGGRDAVPLQPGADIGTSEGDGTVRRQADPVWSYPAATELVRVTIRPITG